MQLLATRTLTGLCVLSAFGAATLETSSAHAAYMVFVTEFNGNVLVQGIGTINLAGLTPGSTSGGNDNDTGYAYASAGLLGLGPIQPTPVDKYNGITGPSSFGTSKVRTPDLGGGDMVMIANYANVLDVPKGYQSGASLNSSSTFKNTTISNLGFTPGIYTWTWGSGATADSFILNIGNVAVPEPASLTALSLGAATLLLRRKR